jgi:hypothetical protein
MGWPAPIVMLPIRTARVGFRFNSTTSPPRVRLTSQR